MTQGDERMKAAKASIRQRLTHSKLPMLVLVGVVLFALIFLGMRFFTRYTREELYRESQNQLTEITSQMYEKLSITLEQQWDFLTVMDRSVAFYAPTTQEALVQLLQATQNQLMSQDSALRFLAIDESGNLINAAGERMPCEFADTLGMTGRQCFLIRGRGGDENQMVFSLPIMQPLTVAMGEKSIRITHLVLLKGMSSLTPFFRSSAFHTQNSTYVVISDGVKMYSDAADENINFLGRNIYPALRTLRYPHAGNFDNCLTELEASDNHFTCTDVLVDKTQYFLCMKRLPGCDWTMLFLVPGVEVAAGARAMVDSITLIVNIAFFVLLLLTVGAMYFLLTAMQNRERYAVETENAQALAQANAELDRARQAAVDALKLAESVQDALEHTPVTAEAVERPEDAVSILRQEDVDVVLLSCQYRAPEMLRPLVRQMREAAGKPIFVFCMQAGQREEVLDIISACGLDGFVPLPFFLSNLENEMAKLRTEFGNIGNVDGTSVLNGMRLLCAEDNPLNAEILEELLHMQGATCTIYSDGKQLVEAFDHVRPSDYDVILMDVQMPVMNGYEATRALRASDNPVGRTIPIIAMTANAFADDIQQSMDAGMDMHLSKPIDIAVLEKTLSLFRTDKKNHGRAVFKRRVMEMEK